MTNKTVNVMDPIEIESIGQPAVAPVVQTTALDWLRWLTVERVLYGVVLLMAIGIRFFALSDQPLNTLEVTNAWPAWLAALAVHVPNAPTPTSPLLYALQTILFWLTGGNDGLARLLPALAGVGAVWLIWYWRDWLGRTPAFFAAFLLAIDPWQVAFSRVADSAMLSTALGLLILIGLTHWFRLASAAKQSRWQAVLAVGTGLLMVSGPQAWSFVPVIALFIFIFGNERKPSAESVDSEPAGKTFLGFSQSALLLFIAAVVLGATGWLIRPEGLGLISRSLTVWFGELLGWSALRYPLSWPFVRLLVDQPLLLIFGLIGLTQLWLSQSALASAAEAEVTEEGPKAVQVFAAPSAARDPQWSLFLILWLCWGLILALLPGRNPAALLMLELPLLLATAHLGDVILQQYRPEFASPEAGLVVMMLVILLISALFWAIAFIAHRQIDSTLAKTTLLIVGLALLLVVAFAFWSDRSQTRFVIGGLGGLVLLLATLASSWQLNHQFDATHPHGFFAEYTHPDVRRLAMDIATLSAQRNGDATEAPLQVQMAAQPDPVLGWYLRNLRQLTWVLAPGATNDQALPLVITLSAKADTQDLLPKYMGSHYDTHVNWLPSALFTAKSDAQADQSAADRYWTQWLQPFLRWMIYREVKPLPATDSVVLWVPAQDR